MNLKAYIRVADQRRAGLKALTSYPQVQTSSPRILPPRPAGRDILPVVPLFLWVMLRVAYRGLDPRIKPSPFLVPSQISY